MLAQIIAQQQTVIKRLKSQLTLVDVLYNVTPTKQSLSAALSRKNSFIFECKKASPSKGLLCEQYDIPNRVALYNTHADAISVLTNQHFFQGHMRDLAIARQHTHLPILCKDFVIDPIQIALARYHGADAILLMLSVLDDAKYQQCAKLAQQLNMDVLTEVHTEKELERALKLNAKLIGINQRNLNDLTIDRNIIQKLVKHIPEDITIVAESGVRSHKDIQSLSPVVNAFLIGTVLNQSSNVPLTIKQLIFGDVKICGLTSKKDALMAYQEGATYGGLNFVPHSSRCISIEAAQAIATATRLQLVGIFANQKIEYVVQTAIQLNLKAVQCHGLESDAYLEVLRQQLPKDIEIWQALSAQNPLPKRLNSNIHKVVIDNQSGTVFGGTQQSFDWTILEGCPYLDKVMIAGGLNPKNCLQAMSIQAGGLDVNSGIELAPGVKCPTKLHNFFETIRRH